MEVDKEFLKTKTVSHKSKRKIDKFDTLKLKYSMQSRYLLKEA